MWDNATDDAHVVIDDLHALNIDGLPEVDMVTIGYPCVGFSKLAAIENKDLLHPQCGALLIPLVAALRQMNPTFFIIENTPCFATSQTLALIQKALPDYNFEQTVLDGHDFNELESRKRACVVATSKGLPRFDVTKINSIYADMEPPKVGDYLEDIPLDSPVWREMAHVKARDTMDNVNFKNHVYYGDENKMVTLPASYSSPKAGTPMIGHPVDMKLQRQVQVDEHSNLRCLPLKLKDVILEVWLGINSLVSAKGSASAAHRLLGNGVSKKVWNSVGDSFGRYLNYIAPTASY
jgi:DNA (cytosine-5)-methyltransferase 1